MSLWVVYSTVDYLEDSAVTFSVYFSYFLPISVQSHHYVIVFEQIKQLMSLCAANRYFSYRMFLYTIFLVS